MTVYYFNNNINILNIKSYCEWLKSKRSWIIIYVKVIEENGIKDNDYSNITHLRNHGFLSNYIKQLDITIIRIEKICIIIKYREFKVKLYIYPYEYDKTIRNLKFECSKYSIDQNIEEYLILLIDRYWNLIIAFMNNNFDTTDYFKVDKRIPNSLEEILN
jgi:hypothetical protein